MYILQAIPCSLRLEMHWVFFGVLLGQRERGQKHGGQNGDDGDDYQQLDQSEGYVSITVPFYHIFQSVWNRLCAMMREAGSIAMVVFHFQVKFSSSGLPGPHNCCSQILTAHPVGTIRKRDEF